MAILPRPEPTSAIATKKMRSNRRVNTKPEVALRSALHRSGLRFRKDYLVRLFDGRTVHPDIVFTKRKIVVFLDGCFWHSCPQHGTTPKSNQDYWIPKLKQNMERDQLINEKLRISGWHVLRIWEHLKVEEALSIILSSTVQSQTMQGPDSSPQYLVPKCC